MSVGVFFASVVLTALLTGALAVYAWSRGDVRGARTYLWLSTTECLLAVAEALSMLAPDTVRALFWWNARFLFTAAMPVAWLVFGLDCSGRAEWRSRRLLLLASVVPVITQVMLWTNAQHGLWVRQEVRFVPEGAFLLAVTADRVPGLWFMFHSFYSLLFTLVGMVLLLVPAWRRAREHAGQTVLLTLGVLIAIAASLIPIFNLLPGLPFNVFIPGIGLSSALIAAAVFGFGFLHRVPEAVAVGGARAEKRSLALFVVVLVLMVSCLAAVGYRSYTTYEQQFRLEVEGQLAAIADLKVDELVEWHNERLADAQVLSDNSSLAALVEAVMADAADAQAASELQAWMSSLCRSYGYDSVLLLDERGELQLASPEDGQDAPAHLAQDAQAALAAGEPALLDFHRDDDGSIRLAVLAPIFSNGPDSRPLGVIALRIDPTRYLYPFLERWPVPSKTAETLLFRREGQDIVYLNPLRFRPDAALNLRLPFERSELLAVRGLPGDRGMIEAVDYRGQTVVGEVREVPDTPWYLAVRMDLDEVYAPLRSRLWETLGLFGSLMVASAAGLWLAWRQQLHRHYRVRVEAAEALRASEDKFRYMFDYAVAGKSITLPSGEINVNRAMCEMLGYSQEELKSRKWQDITHPEDLELTQGMIDSLLSGERDTARFTKRYLHKNGSVVWTDVGTALRRSQDGEPLYFMTSISDITERKRAEVELQVLSSRNEAILAAVPDIIAEVDENKVYTWVNHAGLKFFGEGVIGKEAAFYFEGEQDTYGLVQPLFDGAEDVFYLESWQRRRDGEKRLLGWWCRALKDAEGNVTGALSTARDITEHSLADMRLRETEARYRTLVEYSPIAILVNREDRIVLANKACLELFGATEPGQLTGRSPYELFHPESHSSLRERILQIRDHGQAVPLREEKIIRLDGAVVDVEVTAAPFEDQGGTSIHVVMRDITERKRLEDRLLTLNAELELGVAARTAQLEAANKELEAFGYSVSHDLRAPLRAVHGFSTALLSGYRDQLDEQGRHYLDRIGVAAKHMGDLIDALLVLSRIARQELRHQSVDLSGLAREVAAELQTQDPERLVEWVIADKLPAQGDPRLLSVALQNLLGNAWKFTGPRPQARIEVGALPRTGPSSAPASGGGEEGLVYFVRDNGVGFDMLYADRLFAPFQRLHGMREFPGTGIGLATVQRIIARHGGRVWAEAEVDRGATFYFTLESA